MMNDGHKQLYGEPDLQLLQAEHLRLQGELPQPGEADLRCPRAALSAYQTWENDWLAIVEGQGSRSLAGTRQLETFLAKTRWLARLAEKLGVDSTPLLRFLHEAAGCRFGHLNSLPPLPDDVWVLLDRVALKLKNQQEEAASAPGSCGAKAEDPPVILTGRSKQPLVRGKLKGKLTYARYNVIKALLDAGQDGLTLDNLIAKSRHTDARKILKRLSDSDPDWGAVIHSAGQTGGRYRLA
jgi:hypothetical protein